MQLHYTAQPHWPPLAWLARCEADAVHVAHGHRVECRDTWFCEAVWDGPFETGDLDRTDLVFGSGAKLRGNSVCFVSSGSTVDRLHGYEDQWVWVSNSLACLLEACDGALVTPAGGWLPFFESITAGIGHAHPPVRLSEGTVALTYHDNLTWNGTTLTRTPKPRPSRDFSAFEGYRSFLEQATQRLADNLASRERAHPWTWLGTLSGGYDSAASMTIAREAGLSATWTLTQARPGVEDSGAPIARALGLECTHVGRLDWQSAGSSAQSSAVSIEALFIAGDGQGKEVLFAGAGGALRHRVLVTGTAGDAAWGMQPPSNDFARDNHSGLSLTEHRLHAGYLHVPLPQMGLLQSRDLHRLSHSAELRPWHVHGRYSRPIARRIVEDAGVARDAFASRKTGASIRFVIGEDPWSADGRASFLAWLGTSGRVGAWQRVYLSAALTARDGLLSRAEGKSLQVRLRRKSARQLTRVLARAGVIDLIFVWATEQVRTLYSVPDTAGQTTATTRG